MKSTGNKDLDVVLRLHEARQKKQQAKRWVAARWVVEVEYFTSRDAARNHLARLKPKRRAGLVDCETGDTWANRYDFLALMPAVRKQERAPERFRLKGRIGPIKPKVKRRGRSKR